jgi:NADH-quinone oxidoreductase subunit C
MKASDAVVALQGKFGEAITHSKEFRGEWAVTVPAAQIHAVLEHCKNALGYSMLLDVSSVDHSGQDPRFEVVYHVYDLENAATLRVKCPVDEDVAEVASVVDLWPTADWHEREVWDMMGLRFTNHPDLRRILMWEGYPHFPLRKEFPLAGKDTDVPEVAFTAPAPLQGGPFVTAAGAEDTIAREPRAR